MKLSITQILSVVTNTLGWTSLNKSEDGKLVFTAEEREKLVANFGDKFVELLEKQTPKAEADSTELFNAAVKFAGEKVATEKQTIIDQANDALAAALKTNAEQKAMIAALSAKPEEDPSAKSVAKGAQMPFKADMNLRHNRFAQQVLDGSRQIIEADVANTIDVTALDVEQGTYLSQGNNREIFKELYHKFATSQYLNWKRAVTEWVAAQSHISSVVQRFTNSWTAKGQAKFTPIKIVNRRMKVNYPIIPSQVGTDWLFHLYDESKTPDQMPITKYIVQNVLLPSVVQDIELKMIAKGDYNEGSTNAEAAMDGFETILTDARTSMDRNINFYKTDTDLRSASDATVLATIDAFVKDIYPMYQGVKMPVYLSADLYLKYKRAYKDKWGAGSGTEKVDFGTDRVDFSNFYLVVLPSLYNSPIVFSTPTENFIGLRHINEPKFIQMVQLHDYEVRYYCEFWLGVGFAIGEAVFAICPTGYTPTAAINAEGAGSRSQWMVTAADVPAPAPAGEETPTGEETPASGGTGEETPAGDGTGDGTGEGA